MMKYISSDIPLTEHIRGGGGALITMRAEYVRMNDDAASTLHAHCSRRRLDRRGFTAPSGRTVSTAPQNRLSELGTQFGIPFTVNEIRQHIEPEQLLTDRQLELPTVTIERGYYKTLQECSLTELADELDVAKSTCNETLHRAEEEVIKQFVNRVADATIETGIP